MPSQTDLATIQKYILLATGIPASSALRNQISQLHDQTADFSQIAPLVDDFMSQQVLQNEKGINGVLQTIYINGFSSELEDSEADQLVTDFIAQGINSWSKLFDFLTTDFDVTGLDSKLGSILNSRAQAANIFTDLLVERNLDTFHNNSQATNAAHEWLIGIDSSNESLVSANSMAKDLINRFSIPALELSELEKNDSNSGFVINGVSADDESGHSVSSAGDVNGDGLDDVIVGARDDKPNGPLSGASFVVFGKLDGLVVELSNIENGVGGFVINGISSSDINDLSLSNAGDVNGDGLADIIIGDVFDDPNDIASNQSFIGGSDASFVVFGKRDGTLVELSNIENSTNGFLINGVSDLDFDPSVVSNAGDVNGDGFDDLIVGARNDGSNGVSYVVFGKHDGTTVELSNIENDANGFVINGTIIRGESGRPVSSAGDVNGDGLADLIIGAPGTFGSFINGASFVVFGKRDGAVVELSNIENGYGGFVINGRSIGDRSGTSVSSAGDVNGDGLVDLIIGASGDDPNGPLSGASFVVFGKHDGAAVDLSNVENGMGGFVINGASAIDSSGRSVSSAGDINGDGLNDLIVSADPSRENTDTSYVVFGKRDGTVVELSNIENGTGGFVINGVIVQGYHGHPVSNAGDVNGDGFDDLIIGAIGDDPNGSFSGASFVVFGGQGTSATIGSTGDDTLNGNSSANQFVAGRGNDTVVGNGGADVLRGGAGDDILAISDLSFSSLDGGTGNDTLRFDTPLNLDLRTLADTRLDSIEVIDLTNDSGNSTLTLYLTDLLNLNEAQTASDTLVIHGDTGDTVNLDNTSNGQTGSWANASSGVYEFTAGEIGIIGTVTIDSTVTVNIISSASHLWTNKTFNHPPLASIQKYILLATGIPGSSTLRDQLSQLHNQTGDFSQIAPLVDDFMTQQVLQNEKGVSGVLQAIYINGFSSELTDPEANQLVIDFLAQGIDSWSKLFAFLVIGFDAELSATLNNRAKAANLLADLLAEQKRDDFYNNPQATNAAREWVAGINAFYITLLDANSTVQYLINGPGIELSEIAKNENSDGFLISGGRRPDGYASYVSNAGDVNGDGLGDLIVGIGDENSSSAYYGGVSLVVFGKPGGSAVERSDLENGNGGFVINGVNDFDHAGESVSGAGDVNGDGLADLIVEAPGVEPNGPDSGASFVVFGKNNGAAVELSNIENGNGGFVINGLSANPDADFFNVSGAGDVNGDGLDDLIVGVPFAPLIESEPISEFVNTFARGSSFVIFGKSNETVVELSNIESSNGGFVINGVNALDTSGASVSGAGDVNGDGLADLIIGAPLDSPNGNYSGASFVVFGKNDDAIVELSNIEKGNGGFVINGVNAFDGAGVSVNGAGDVNGDGLADLIIGAPYFEERPNNSFDPFVNNTDDINNDGLTDLNNPNGTSYVVFGKSDGAAIELSSIESNNSGFVINGASASDGTGEFVNGAGDVNGDGRDDLIIGASDSSNINGIFSGTSFVVFGKDDGTAVELSDIESDTGFVINGEGQSGYSVSSAGDVDGDGFADLIVGTRWDRESSSFVIFGGQSSSATVGTSGTDTLTGDNGANQLVSGTGDDILIGNGGADVLRGGAGNDILAISDLTFASLDGGTGSDTLRFDAALNLDLRTLADTKLMSIEVIDLTNDDGNSTISLNLTDLLNLNEAQTAANTLEINGNVGDIVNLDDSSNGQTGTWTDAGGGVYQFSVGGIGVIGTTTIDAAVTVNIIV